MDLDFSMHIYEKRLTGKLRFGHELLPDREVLESHVLSPMLTSHFQIIILSLLLPPEHD